MFYIAEAFLAGKGLAFSKHSAVHAAFGEHFIKTGILTEEFHKHLIRAMEVRHAGDYQGTESVSREVAEKQIEGAGRFLELAERMI